jgi:hypothetical protein
VRVLCEAGANLVDIDWCVSARALPRCEYCRDINCSVCALPIAQMCILAGCDYLSNLKGVGLITAAKMLDKYAGDSKRVGGLWLFLFVFFLLLFCFLFVLFLLVFLIVLVILLFRQYAGATCGILCHRCYSVCAKGVIQCGKRNGNEHRFFLFTHFTLFFLSFFLYIFLFPTRVIPLA